MGLDKPCIIFGNILDSDLSFFIMKVLYFCHCPRFRISYNILATVDLPSNQYIKRLNMFFPNPYTTSLATSPTIGRAYLNIPTASPIDTVVINISICIIKSNQSQQQIIFIAFFCRPFFLILRMTPCLHANQYKSYCNTD